MLKSDPASLPNPGIAFVAAAFYALHPANADAVDYVIVSAEVISALGVVASFAVYFAFPRHRRYFLYVLPAAIAILAKPTAAIFPILFALFRNFFPERVRRSSSLARIGETILPFVICGSVLLFVQHMTPSTWVAGAINAKSYLVTQPYVALLYFKTFFWPTGLSADYDLAPFVTTGDPRLWIGVAFIVFVILAAVTAAIFKKTRLTGFGLFWFLVALLPTALFPLAEVMNDYRAFLPYVGLVIALAPGAAWLVARLRRQPTWEKVAAICAVALLLSASAYATFQRNKVWQNDETLWHDVVLKSPHHGRGLMAYGIQLMNKGDYAGALAYFHRAKQFTPHYYFLLINLAIAEGATDQSVAAERHFQEALQSAPSYPDSYIYYARYLLKHSSPEDARPLLQKALELSPGDLTAQQLLKEASMSSAEAGTSRGNALLRDGRIGEAITQYEAALQISPHFVPSLNNLAWVLATSPDASLRNGRRALKLAEEAVQITSAKNGMFLRTLAAAYAENGRFDDAIETAQRSLQLANSQSDFALTAKLNKDVNRYQHSLPLHQVVEPATP